MDLSKLSSDLPATTSIESVSLPSLNAKLTDHFKDAAKSVTSLYNSTAKKDVPEPASLRRETQDSGDAKKAFSDAARAVATLYRAGTETNVLLMHKGYLDSLDDLTQIIARGEDIENWVLTRRAELVNYYNQMESTKEPPMTPATPAATEQPVQESTESSERDNDSLTTSLTFGEDGHPDSAFNMPLDLATDMRFRPSFPPLSMTYKRRKGRKDGSRRKVVGMIPDSAGSSEDSEGEYLDCVDQKRRARSNNSDATKRRKRDSL